MSLFGPMMSARILLIDNAKSLVPGSNPKNICINYIYIRDKVSIQSKRLIRKKISNLKVRGSNDMF